MHLISYICFNFIFYSFLGWIIEEIYGYYINKNFNKPNFLTIPLKPMYGISMTILIIINEIVKVDLVTFILLCFIVPTSVEYISGYILKNIFNEVYWSYSGLKYNIKGYICLKFSIYWQILSFIGVYYLQPEINNIYRNILNGKLTVTMIIIINCIVMLDFIMKVEKTLKKH